MKRIWKEIPRGDKRAQCEFPDAEIDPDGILVLNLRTARVSNRAINHPTRRLSLVDGKCG